MYNKFGTVLAVAIAIFPFAAVVAKMAATEASTTVLVVAAIFVVFFAVLLVATRITLEPDAEVSRTPRAPAPPIAWSWDGVNRTPGDDGDSNGAEVEAHH